MAAAIDGLRRVCEKGPVAVMPWGCTVHADLPIIETVYAGRLDPGELSAACAETLALVRRHGTTRLLADCSTLEGGHSVFDLYALADAVASSGIGHALKEAVLLPAGARAVGHVAFWETTSANRGLNVRVFRSRREAIEWLMMD